MPPAEQQLAQFLARFTPEMAGLGATLVARFRQRLPFADALIFDNYNFLGVGFSVNGKSSGVFVSVVLYPRWANVFFFNGALMEDRAGLLAGDGALIRHVRVEGAAAFARMDFEPLVVQAIDLCRPPPDLSHSGELRVHAVSARQRPRRPKG